MSSPSNPIPARTPAFFEHCNEASAYLRTEYRVARAFQTLGVSPEAVKEAAATARTIWKTRNGPTPADFAKKDPADTRRREEAVAELCSRFPAVFQIACVETNEETFVRVRAPNVLIVLANRFLQRSLASRYGREKKDIEAARDGSEDIAEGVAEEVDDTEMDNAINTNKETHAQPTTTDTKKPQTPGTAVIKGSLFTGPPFSIEVRTAKKGVRLLNLGWKHVLGEGGVPSYDILQNTVRAFPLINWPKNVLFVHVVDNINIFVFEQATLETTFTAWRQRAPAASTFLLYANDYEGVPPTQIPGEASSDN